MSASQICGKKMGDDVCGLKPGHEKQIVADIGAGCQAMSCVCPRQHVGGFVHGCLLCIGEDLAVLRPSMQAMRSDMEEVRRGMQALAKKPGFHNPLLIIRDQMRRIGRFLARMDAALTARADRR